MQYDQRKYSIRTTEVVAILIVIVAAAAILSPIIGFSQVDESKAICQRNMKELGTALCLYYNDYDSVLPSSAQNGSATWNELDYKRFATIRGTLPPPIEDDKVTLTMLLYQYMKNKDIIWCPSDSGRKDYPGSQISYWYKAAIDRAWYGGVDSNGEWACKRERDFGYPSDQVVFYERAGWHWGDEEKGLSEKVTLNACFLDGHVRPVRLRGAGNKVGKSYPTAIGEPGWFNQDYTNGKPLGKGKYFDPRNQGDALP